MKKPTKTIQIPREIPEHELLKLSQDQNRIMREIEELQNALKAYAKAEKAKMEEKYNEVKELGIKISTGIETVDKAVYERKNFDTGMIYFICVTTGEVVDQKEIPAREIARQTSIEDHEYLEVAQNNKEAAFEFFRKEFSHLVGKGVYGINEFYEANKTRLVVAFINDTYEVEGFKEGTDFDTAYDAVLPFLEEFFELIMLEESENPSPEANYTVADADKDKKIEFESSAPEVIENKEEPAEEKPAAKKFKIDTKATKKNHTFEEWFEMFRQRMSDYGYFGRLDADSAREDYEAGRNAHEAARSLYNEYKDI